MNGGLVGAVMRWPDGGPGVETRCMVIRRDPWKAIQVHGLIVRQMVARRALGLVAGAHRRHRYLERGPDDRYPVGTVYVGTFTRSIYRVNPKGRAATALHQRHIDDATAWLDGQALHSVEVQHLGRMRAPFRWLAALAADEGWPGA